MVKGFNDDSKSSSLTSKASIEAHPDREAAAGSRLLALGSTHSFAIDRREKMCRKSFKRIAKEVFGSDLKLAFALLAGPVDIAADGSISFSGSSSSGNRSVIKEADVPRPWLLDVDSSSQEKMSSNKSTSSEKVVMRHSHIDSNESVEILPKIPEHRAKVDHDFAIENVRKIWGSEPSHELESTTDGKSQDCCPSQSEACSKSTDLGFIDDSDRYCLEVLSSIPRNEFGHLTSMGSCQHDTSCTPCAYWFKGICKNGLACQSCHFVHDGQRTKRLRPSKLARERYRSRGSKCDDPLRGAEEPAVPQPPGPVQSHILNQVTTARLHEVAFKHGLAVARATLLSL